MRIGIDNVSTGLSTGRNTLGGMRHFLTDLTSGLEKLGPQHEFVLFQPNWADPLDLPGDTRIVICECRGVPRKRPGRVAYEQAIYPSIVGQAGVDVFLGTNNVLPLRSKVPSVVVVQSLQYFDFPQLYSLPNLAYLRTVVPWTLRKATRIIVLSQLSKRTIVERVGGPAERVRVVYHGLSSNIECEREGENYEQGKRLVDSLVKGKPFVLSVSSFYWQKNLPRLVEAFAILKRRHGVPHSLLLAGADGIKVTRRQLLDLAAQLGIEGDVICPGVVPHSLISAFYLNASVTVMPSLSETFGHPVLEAMSCGCPVVTSKASTMAEIAQGCAVLVDPFCADDIAEGMARILEQEDLRNSLIVQGRARAQRFTPEARARRYLEILEEAVDGK